MTAVSAARIGRSRVAARSTPRYVVLALICLVFLLPIAWMLSSSLKSSVEVLDYPPHLIPEHFNWSSYSRIFTYQPFADQFRNSVIIMVAVCLITGMIGAMAGYSLAKCRVRGATLIFMLVLSGIFIPPEATIIPLYKFAARIGWLDSPYPLIVFTSFTATGALSTFIMRQAFLTIPREFEEAARVDGAGRWLTFFRVMLPMVRPSIAAVFVVSAWVSWNQYLEPLVYLRTSSHFTVSLGLSQYVDPYNGPLYNVQLAATTLSVLPVLIVFLLAQRQVIAGLTAGGVKG